MEGFPDLYLDFYVQPSEEEVREDNIYSMTRRYMWDETTKALTATLPEFTSTNEKAFEVLKMQELAPFIRVFEKKKDNITADLKSDLEKFRSTSSLIESYESERNMVRITMHRPYRELPASLTSGFMELYQLMLRAKSRNQKLFALTEEMIEVAVGQLELPDDAPGRNKPKRRADTPVASAAEDVAGGIESNAKGKGKEKCLDDDQEKKKSPKRIPGDTCAYCGTSKPDLQRCGRCREATYCNRACRKADWKTHKKTCKWKN
ncbi:MAG: hypothetical protein M1820_003333 [Bogoriella megaspora]|nr:MAG: hypothetical protein M1820_003333 [Bogoriella megaspora]